MGKRVLLKDIAEKTGLTINTVSRALNDKSDISEKTKELIRKVSKEMGYVPNQIASSLRTGYTNTIAILFDNIANYYYMIMTELLHKKLAKEGFEVMIFTSSGKNAQFDLNTYYQMVSRQIDGIITFLRPTTEVSNQIIKGKMPTVVIGRESDDLGIDSVYTNDFNGGYIAGKHLIKTGHDKVAYIGAPSDIKCSTKRFEGIEKAFNERGLKNNLYGRFLNHNTDVVEDLVNEAIKNKVTGIFCFNDAMAYEAIKIIQKNNLKIPNDIAVIGYDDIEERSKIPVNLTTINTSKEEITQTTVDFLVQRINDFDKPLAMKVYEPELIKRMTT